MRPGSLVASWYWPGSTNSPLSNVFAWRNAAHLWISSSIPGVMVTLVLFAWAWSMVSTAWGVTGCSSCCSSSGHDEYCGHGAAHGPDLRRKSRPAGGTHRPVRSPGPDPLRSACDCRARCAPTGWRRHVTGRHAYNLRSGTSQVTSRCVLDTGKSHLTHLGAGVHQARTYLNWS